MHGAAQAVTAAWRTPGQASRPARGNAATNTPACATQHAGHVDEHAAPAPLPLLGLGQLAHDRLLPWACRDVPLGGDVLEIGPGYGVTTSWLRERAATLTAVEVDGALVADLRARFAGVDVHPGDGAALPFADASFDTVVCFTMLHHVPTPEHQDRIFAEAARVLRPGGVFAGSDSRLNLRFRLLHVADTMTVVDPDTLPDRLRAAGFADVHVGTVPRSLRFRVTRPG